MALVLWNALFSPFTKLWYSDDTPEIEEPSGQPYESDAELWNNEVGKMLNMMLELAGYPENSRTIHSEFFRGSVAPSLGHHPRGTGDPLHWKSFMTDDHTPVELSWCWSTALDTPTVRYSVEPIGKWAGQPVDPINTLASLRLLGDALQLSPEMDLYLHRHFQKSLMSPKSSNEDPITQNPQSQSFMAFDLLEKTIVVKQYYLPTWRALAEKKTNFAVVEEAILNVPALGNSLLSSFSIFTNYLESFPQETRPAVEIMAIDCLDPLNSRIKVYVRSRSTNLKSVFDTLTIGGKAPKSSDEEQSLRELWHSVFGLNQDQSDETPLSQNDHRTGGILYYFEFKSGTPVPKTKVYLPVRHYAQNDDQIARGLSGFLDRRGKKLATGSYLEGVQTLW
ncbi:Aromatic prenyltransferase DMATS type [Penicillium expansum]|nr:Aromatic prenyltransferase DMATS type [Penicillium expansum]